MSQIITFEKIVPEGKAMGHLSDGRAVFAIGPLPGETAEVGITKHKKRYAEAVLRKIVQPSPRRSGKAEDHALSCSPWQDVEYGHQLELKAEMFNEAFRQHKVAISPLGFVGAPNQFGYRNRLDFTLHRNDDGVLKLAFHKRGSWDTLLPLANGCRLASVEMNQAALAFVRRLNELEAPIHDGVLIARQSHTTGKILLILVTELKSYQWDRLAGFPNAVTVVTRPLPGSGAPGELIYAEAAPELTEDFDGITITYPYDSFFQTNVPAFKAALNHIVEAAQDRKNIVELYSGVGSIGLPLAKTANRVTGVEITESSVEYARRNATSNGIGNYFEQSSPAEAAELTMLAEADGLVLDPPRAGLHPHVTKQILEHTPQRIIYLSCNPITQARDIAALAGSYKLTSLRGFDFYPGTLHMESLAILDRV